jgi:hypothetical protein
MTRQFFDLGWIVRVRDSRAVRVTGAGRTALFNELGLHIDANEVGVSSIVLLAPKPPRNPGFPSRALARGE